MQVPLRFPLIGPSFNNRLSYDWRIFPLIEPLLESVARIRYYRSPAKPFFWCDKLVELPVTGPDDFYLIANETGPQYSPQQAPRIAEIWLDILADIKARGDKLFVVLAHPVRISPFYIDTLHIFIKGLLNDDQVEIKSLKEVAESL
jgi:hypothetical protein